MVPKRRQRNWRLKNRGSVGENSSGSGFGSGSGSGTRDIDEGVTGPASEAEKGVEGVVARKEPNVHVRFAPGT